MSIVAAYALILIAYSIADIATYVLPTVKWAGETAGYMTYLGFGLYNPIIGIIAAAGLLMRKPWARAAVLAVMLTFPISVAVQIMWWGTASLEPARIGFGFASVCATFVYFYRQDALAPKDGGAKLLTRVLVASVFMLSLMPVAASLYTKATAEAKFGGGFFTEAPEIKRLDRISEMKGMRRIEALNVSILVPEGFAVSETGASDGGLKVTLSAKERGFIMLTDRSPYDVKGPLGERLETAGVKGPFDVERFVRLNDWNPAAIMMRGLMMPECEDYALSELRLDDMRGFVSSCYKKGYSLHEFTLYGKGDNTFSGGSLEFRKDEGEDAIKVISSIVFLEGGSAEEHYAKGTSLLNAGDIAGASAEFERADYLSPGTPEYVYALAKVYYAEGPEKYDDVRKQLSRVLALNPEHEGARSMLREIAPEYPVDPG